MPRDETEPGDTEPANKTPQLAESVLGFAAAINRRSAVKDMAGVLAAANGVRYANWFQDVAATQKLGAAQLAVMQVPTLRPTAALAMAADIRSFVEPKWWSDLAQAQSAFRNVQRAQWTSVIEGIRESAQRARERMVPPNWEQLWIDPDDFEPLLLDEGLCLAWTPPNAVLRRLIAADAPKSRRSIVGRAWNTILAHASDQAGNLANKDLQGYGEFASAAINAILDGHNEAGQALASNLLETVLSLEFEKDAAREIKSHKKGRIDLGPFTMRSALVFGGIWGSYSQYDPGTTGSGVPTRYNRHASAHAVTRRQYSRINATVAVMHATALLSLIDSGEFD